MKDKTENVAEGCMTFLKCLVNDHHADGWLFCWLILLCSEAARIPISTISQSIDQRTAGCGFLCLRAVHLHFNLMTLVSTANITADTAALVAECGGSSSNQVDIMIGIGLVKDSEAVFFQYVGEDGNSQALVRDNGKPVTRIAPVMLTGIGVADGIGEFNTKLNIFVETQSGRTVMLASGLKLFGLSVLCWLDGSC